MDEEMQKALMEDAKKLRDLGVPTDDPIFLQDITDDPDGELDSWW